MGRAGGRSVLFLAVLMAIALGSASSHAWAQVPQWTKLYDCTTSAPKHGIRVQLMAEEVINDQYKDPTYPVPPASRYWSPGCLCTGSGGSASRIYYPGCRLPLPGGGPGGKPPMVHNRVTIGWTTFDNECRVTDMSWMVPTTVPDPRCVPDNPVQRSQRPGGCPGGGVAFYNYPERGDLTVAITNDNVDPMGERENSQLGLSFGGVDYAISSDPLPMEYLYRLLSDGFCRESVEGGDILPPFVTEWLDPSSGTVSGVSATDAAEGVQALREKVAKAGLPGSMEALLHGPLDSAANDVAEGLRAYYSGNRLPEGAATAQEQYRSAAQAIQAFADAARARPLPEAVLNRWLVRDEDPESGCLRPTASRVFEALSALSERPLMLQGHPLTSLRGPEHYHQPRREVAGSEYVPWLSIVRAMAVHSEGEWLYPGHYTEIVIPGPLRATEGAPAIPEGGALIVRGELRDGEGNTFKWLEQIIAAEAPPDEMGSPEGIGSED